MTVAVVASLVGLLAVVVALAKDRPLDALPPAGPAWDTLPSPDDVTRVTFPLAVPGYDPVHVEAHLDAVRRAYEDVLDVLPADVLERARFRSAMRAGREHVPVAQHPMGALAWPDVARAPVDSDQEALRTVAALSQLEQRPTR